MKALARIPPCSAKDGAAGVGVGVFEGKPKSSKPSSAKDFSSVRGVRGGDGEGVSFVEEAFDGVRA